MKFPELKDYLSMISGGSVHKDIVKILQEKVEENIDSELEELKIINNKEFSKILFYFKASTKEKRIQAFSFLLKNMIESLYSSNLDEYAENKQILERALQDYLSNFNVKIDNTELFDNMIKNNQKFKFTKFSFLEECSCNEVKQCVGLGGRYGVGKTVGALNLIEDALKSNENIAILYFGTSEVDKEAFLKRFMTMRSSYPIKQFFNDLDSLKVKRDEIEKVIKILKYDIKQSLTYIQQNLKSSKYFSLSNEKKENLERISLIEKEILEKKKSGQNDVFLKSQIDKKISEINSLKLKNKEKEKNLVTFLENDSYYFNIIEKIFFGLEEKIKEINLDETKKQININKEDFIKLEKINLQSKKKSGEIDIEETYLLVEKISKFVKYLILNDGIFSKENIKEDIEKAYNEYLNDIENQINEKQGILYDEYNKTIAFLQKEVVEIEDKLNIVNIEQKIKLTRLKYPERKLMFIIDYHQKVDGFPTQEGYKKSFMLGEKMLDLCTKYNAYGIVMSQLKNMFDSKSAANKGTKGLGYRPEQADLRDGEGLAINIGSLGMIFNRDTFPLQEGENINNIDQNFSIYEIYLTKNRYGANGLNQTRQYFIFDKKKISYLPVDRKWYQILNDNKDILYLSQLFDKIKEVQAMDNLTIDDVIE